MRKLLVISLLSGQLLTAQSLNPNGSPRQSANMDDVEFDRRVKQDAFERWALDPNAPKRAENARQAEAALEFYSKARAFVDLWQTFAAELNEKKTFNAKLAKQISKAFHDLEKSDGWPTGHNK